jgi:hypothetical protein
MAMEREAVTGMGIVMVEGRDIRARAVEVE